MKYNYLFILVLSLSAMLNAQEIKPLGGEYKFYNATECVSDSQRQAVIDEINSNVTRLQAEGKLKDDANRQNLLVHPNFIWPVVKNPTAPYANVWSISNHVDHNPNYPNSVQDWNCGPRTYDTSSGYNHQGIDIFTWPFSWYQLDNNQAWIVAAAPGTIVGKSDGNYDRNCTFNNSNWNAVYVQHADGSRAWYGHMKSGSLTSKSVGDIVAEGEFLGVVGSSGNSTGPHLHFEVYNASNQLIDPYQGACNTWTSSNDSWWQTQKNYQDPKINAVLTHTIPPVFNACATTETTNLSDSFSNGSSVCVTIYLADQLPGTTGILQLKRPDNTIATTRTANMTDFYYASYWYWTFNAAVFNQEGTWTATLAYQGQTVSHTFTYGALGVTDNFEDNFTVYPNPANDVLTVESLEQNRIKTITFHDMLGKKVHTVAAQFDKINVAMLTSGIYFIQVDAENGIYRKKFIKN